MGVKSKRQWWCWVRGRREGVGVKEACNRGKEGGERGSGAMGGVLCTSALTVASCPPAAALMSAVLPYWSAASTVARATNYNVSYGIDDERGGGGGEERIGKKRGLRKREEGRRRT